MHRVSLRQRVTHQSMTALVIGNCALRIVVHNATFALRTSYNALHALGDFLH